MLRVGLTGGIGCGKSMVAGMLRDHGCLVLDADALAHQLLVPGQAAYHEVLLGFGAGICDEIGRIDRTKLAAIVFNDPAKLARLNKIIHPRVIAAQDRQFAEWSRSYPRGIAVIEAALLIEAGIHERPDGPGKLDRLAVVWCHSGQQLARLLARGMSAEDAQKRISAQLPIEEKRRLATDEIDNSGTEEETRQQVQQVVARWKQLAA
ncbi:MAG TPA: dephospho-CoA kinase [Candidatus Dormibacteraeota bacterium]|nr:dephospho-CoA kinase [Candidatus Dormibacteraeota bacterium]